MTGNEARDALGCIVTIENLTTRDRRTIHIPGQRLAGARRVAALCDTLGVDWKVASYSTPLTIASDLDGTRLNSDVRHPGVIEQPEVNTFGRIGRVDVVHPRLHGGVAREGRRRGRAA